MQGASLDVARSGIEGRGLSVGSITSQVSAQAEGTIVSQTPSPGSEVESGAAVDLVIAEHESTPSNNDYNESYRESSNNTSSNESNEVFETGSSTSSDVSAPSRDGFVSKQR